ncbi:ribosome biogenesis protein bop1 [Megalops cyprinoides]|uniref:ribosome biogenesis protein bop1 n=1 Tax=Megalops cyprinoides TaxID=118141 RepID=UPI00186527E7|nr:ribosome biogenesis protein bop1 [Megalops cyprinoides]
MPVPSSEVRQNGTMSKAKGKSVKRGNSEEDEEQLSFINSDGDDDASKEKEEDLTDSEESVFSGLEDSGSDSNDEDDEDDGDDEEGESDEDAPSADENGEDSTPAEESEKQSPAIGTKDMAQAKTEPQKEGTKKRRSSRKLEQESDSTRQPTVAPLGDEYEQDTSDEEDIRNTVGNIPMEWYKDYPHIGYDLDGKKIFKPIRNKDELDEFLDKMENPDYWRTVHDKMTGTDIRLSDEQVDLVHRLQRGQFGDVNFNEYEPSLDFFSGEVMIHPVTNRPQDKRSFIPSLIEKEKVSKLVHAIKMGWIKPRKPKDTAPQYYDLWAKEDPNAILGRHKMHVPAPKMRLPGHEESYNPPPEYLPTEEEKLAWEQQDPEDRKLNFLPQKYPCLRAVPAFSRFIHDRFERCLDLYLCPRQRKMRVNVDPEDLIPKLPKPKDLQPFPTTQALVYRGHSSLVRCISVSPSGQWLASGSDDCTVRFWEVSTARCMKTVEVGGAVKSIAWNPNPAISLVAVCFDQSMLVLNPGLGDKLVCSTTDQLISSYVEPEEERPQPVQWVTPEGKDHEKGIRLIINHPKAVRQVTWHGKGDYLASVMPDNSNTQVLIHQVSKRRTQNPFRKNKGLVQCVSFHPIRPYFFVATQRYVRVYNLIKQELTKKLMANCKWISSMAIHPAGDNVICGSYDSRLAWFDLDLSTKPYKVLRHHKKALRGVAFHRHYPLFASASDDGSVIVCHGMVYNDLLQNPLIVPVKVLKGHAITHDLGVLDVAFHPTQPWVFSSGADGTVRLFS